MEERIPDIKRRAIRLARIRKRRWLAVCSQGNGDGFHDIAKNGIRGLRLFLQRGVARTGDDAVRENGNGKLLEIVGEAILAAIEKGACLRGALEHECAAGTDA